MKIIFLTDGIDAPGSRFRCEQFFESFEARGISCELKYAYGHSYNRVHNKRWSALYKAACRAKRAILTASANADVVFLQRTAFPQSAAAEYIANLRGQSLIFDFDDSLWLGPGGRKSSMRMRAFETAVRISDHLIAGNAFLAKVANHPEKTTIIPTVIDTDRYVPGQWLADSRPVIGWMGTSGNFPFLEQLVPSLKRVLETGEATVRLVSNAPFEPLVDEAGVEQIRWSASTEIQLLQSFDIGLMPLVESPLTRGKCAFKMITYMACATPVVVSAVGANIEVFNGSNSGYCLDGFDWTEALLDLVRSPELRRRMGEAGRGHAVENYSIHAVIDTYIDLFEQVASDAR